MFRVYTRAVTAVVANNIHSVADASTVGSKASASRIGFTSHGALINMNKQHTQLRQAMKVRTCDGGRSPLCRRVRAPRTAVPVVPPVLTSPRAGPLMPAH